MLRPLTMDDAEGLFSYASDPDITLHVTFDAHRSIEDNLEFLTRVMSRVPTPIEIGAGTQTLSARQGAGSAHACIAALMPG